MHGEEHLAGTVWIERFVADPLSANMHVRVQAVNADIGQRGPFRLHGVVARAGRYEFNAHSGNVRLILANPSGFELDASTFSGSIRTDFPVTLRATPETRNPRGRGLSNRAVRGTYGDGSAFLLVRSFSGTVVIGKK